MQPTNSALSKRRRFQSSITSYFPSPEATSANSSVSHNHYSAATFSATPVVSAKVQASLLSVGMRVRKSVADGYKTQIAMEKEKMAPVLKTPGPSVSQPYSNPTRSELAPFSGDGRSSNSLVTDDGDAFSLPPSSQESASSDASVPMMPNGQKRRFDIGGDIFADDSDSESETFPSFQVPPLGRPILSPSLGQQRRRILSIQRKSLANDEPTMELDDFEEASFLRRREEVDADYQMDCA